MTPRAHYWKSDDEVASRKSDYVIRTASEYNDLFGKIKANDGWLRPFMYLCRVYYAANPSGGSLHIVLEDGNIDDNHVDWCAGLAYGVQDHAGMDIADLMQAMSLPQRRTVYSRSEEYS